MGMSWPSHRAQPLGAKLPVKILISAKNGFDIIAVLAFLVLRGEYPLKSNDEVQHQVRRHVLVRLVSPDDPYRGGVHGAARGSRVDVRLCSPQISGWGGCTRCIRAAHWHMVVCWKFGNVQRVRQLATHLPQDNPVTDVHGRASLQVGQAEIHSSVATISGTQDGKQSLVLVDGQ